MSHYTDEDVQACKRPILDNFHPPTDRFSSWHIRPEEMARAVLDAVTPAIEARAKAEAVADLADRLERAQAALNKLAREERNATEGNRLTGKANGIALALSYVREIERGAL